MKQIIIFLCLFLFVPFNNISAETENIENSVSFSEKLNPGWNLGNSFDGFDTNGDRGELSWGNPAVTRELIHNVRDKGFNSIRIPLTTSMRTSQVGDDYVVDTDFLARYKEVVDWALDEGLYVVTNLHHDSWEWLANWDGQIDSDEFNRFSDFWIQISDLFEGYDEKLIFESINEPQFWQVEDQQSALDILNDEFLKIIRVKHPSRYVLIPTYLTDSSQDKLNHTKDYIKSKNDSKIIATIHYYSEWVYSTNLGIVGFDEDLWGNGNHSSRDSMHNMFNSVKNTFIDNDIGVVIGEYGLLGYDKNDNVLDENETYKFIDEINKLARNNRISLMLWDNGQHLNRYDDGKTWHNPIFGKRLIRSIYKETPYLKDFSYVFIKDINDLFIEKEINSRGIKISRIDVNDESVELDKFKTNDDKFQIKDENLVEKLFSKSEDFIINIVYEDDFILPIRYIFVNEPELLIFEGDTQKIPIKLNGHMVKSIESRNSNGDVISNNSWWKYLEKDFEFSVDNHHIFLRDELWDLFNEEKPIILKINFYDGSNIEYVIDENNYGHEKNKVTLEYQFYKDGELFDFGVISGYPGEEFDLTGYHDDVAICDNSSGIFTKSVDKLRIDCLSKEQEIIPDIPNEDSNVVDLDVDIIEELPQTGHPRYSTYMGWLMIVIGIFVKKINK